MWDRVKSLRLLQTVKACGKDQPLISYSFRKRELFVLHPGRGAPHAKREEERIIFKRSVRTQKVHPEEEMRWIGRFS